MSRAKPRFTRRRGDQRLTECVSLKLAPGAVDALSVHAIRRGEFVSDVIRRAIDRLLVEEGQAT